MATRDWDEEFAQIQQEYYPGSSKPIVRHPNRAENKADKSTRDSEDWDANPRTYTVNGEEVEFFTIGQLAKALGRQPVTVRKWERLGIIPKARFQAPSKSDDPRGRRRLYTRAQVEGIVRIAAEEGVLVSHQKPITQTAFTERVIDLFKELTEAA